MYFPYGIWKDAEREARRLPPSDNNGCGLIIMLYIGSIILVASLKAGGFGILLGLAIVVGMIHGMMK